MQVKFLLGITLISLLLACGIAAPEPAQEGDSGPLMPPQVVEWAECLANPENAMHVQGQTVESYIVEIDRMLKAGETDMAEIEAGLEMFCDGG